MAVTQEWLLEKAVWVPAGLWGKSLNHFSSVMGCGVLANLTSFPVNQGNEFHWHEQPVSLVLCAWSGVYVQVNPRYPYGNLVRLIDIIAVPQMKKRRSREVRCRVQRSRDKKVHPSWEPLLTPAPPGHFPSPVLTSWTQPSGNPAVSNWAAGGPDLSFSDDKLSIQLSGAAGHWLTWPFRSLVFSCGQEWTEKPLFSVFLLFTRNKNRGCYSVQHPHEWLRANR